jgi:sigma-E factor negative regulatory protein RseC
MNNRIQHKGVIERIELPRIYVRIVQQSACSGCKAKSFCTSSDSQTKTIEIEDSSGKFAINEEVMICGQFAMGMQAVWLAFILPLLFIVLFVMLGTSVFQSELIGGLAGLLVLFPYYFIIYMMRDKLKKKFVFTLSKIEEFI